MSKKIKSIKDLNKLRDSVKSELDLRKGIRDIQVTIPMGTCGIAAGARDVLDQLIEELHEADSENVTVSQSGCLGLCDQEPMMTVTDKTGMKFYYGRLDKYKVHRIVVKHLCEGSPVSELIVKKKNKK